MRFPFGKNDAATAEAAATTTVNVVGFLCFLTSAEQEKL